MAKETSVIVWATMAWLLVIMPFSGLAQSIPLKEKIALAQKQLVSQPTNQKAYQELHFLITNYYNQHTIAERAKLRKILEQYAIWSSVTICSKEELGTKISIKGKVTDKKGKPIVNAFISIFQTDAKGYYTPNDSAKQSMGENDPRLFGFLRTDSTGAYEFRTVRPASYPRKYEGKTIPQHIHFNTYAEGFRERKIQMVFEDDPAMLLPYWKDWAKKMNFPIVRIIYSKTEPYGVNNVILSK